MCYETARKHCLYLIYIKPRLKGQKLKFYNPSLEPLFGNIIIVTWENDNHK